MAEITIICPHCNQELSIDEQFLGMEVECPTCNKTFAATEKKIAAVPVTAQAEPEVANNVSIKQLGKQGADLAKNILNFAAPKVKSMMSTVADNINNRNDNSDTSDSSDDRVILLSFFEKVKPESDLESVVDMLCFNFMTAKQFDAFNRVKATDHEYWKNLDILKRFGKDTSQLVAEPKMLTEPVMAVPKSDNVEPKVAYFVDKEGDWHLANSLVYITKLYTFEDQLFAYRAVWDYTSQCVWHEDTEAFFFTDITNISTSTVYGSAIERILPSKMSVTAFSVFGIVMGLIFGGISGCEKDATAGFIIGFLTAGLSLLIGWLIYFSKIKKRKRSVRRLETFDIQSSSGSAFSISMISDEWLKIKRNLYHKKANWMEGVIQDYTTRSEEEKIIHAIRKMIEEKKVSVNE